MGNLAWRFDNKERQYIEEVLSSGFASGTSGNMNTRLEKAFAEKIGKRFSITFNSGTTTLHTALVALGVGYGDEVILPALTVISCMNAIIYCNAVPVFADVDPITFTINPADIRKKITKRTKVIMPVHLYGQVCNMTEIMKIAKEFNLKVVEDCAQCYGTHQSKNGGTFGDVGSWSFENSKHLTTGDGGIIACDDEELADKIRKLQCQGFRNATAVSGKIRIDKDVFQNPDYKRHTMLGYMYRLPEVAAAMGLAQVEKLNWFVSLRIKMAKMYADTIKSTGIDWLKPQYTHSGDTNSYYTFAAKFIHPEVKWADFRKKYVENGGDGIYAAWAPLYKEDSIEDTKQYMKSIGLSVDTFDTVCPVTETIQRQLMQLTTNQHTDEEMEQQAEVLYKTIMYYK